MASAAQLYIAGLSHTKYFTYISQYYLHARDKSIFTAAATYLAWSVLKGSSK